jgi:hypothetical protein
MAVLGVARFGNALRGEACPCLVWHGLAGRGEAWRGPEAQGKARFLTKEKLRETTDKNRRRYPINLQSVY